MEEKKYIPNIPESDKPRLVIIGGGFAGLKLVKNLLNKNNFHQFQPLLYQVARAGLEPSAISFPLRKILQPECNVHFRMAEILEISALSKEIRTNIGYLNYDYLALAMGTNPNFSRKTTRNWTYLRCILSSTRRQTGYWQVCLKQPLSRPVSILKN